MTVDYCRASEILLSPSQITECLTVKRSLSGPNTTNEYQLITRHELAHVVVISTFFLHRRLLIHFRNNVLRAMWSSKQPQYFDTVKGSTL